jgi:hypothetical protein
VKTADPAIDFPKIFAGAAGSRNSCLLYEQKNDSNIGTARSPFASTGRERRSASAQIGFGAWPGRRRVGFSNEWPAKRNPLGLN